MRKAFYITILIFLPYALAAQDNVTVRAAFDSSRIYIGDQINFTVTIEKAGGTSLTLPAFKDTLARNIEIIKGPEVDSLPAGNGRIRIIEKYLVTSFDSGFYEIKPVYAESKTPDGVKRFYSDYARLEVMKYKVAPADSTARIYDIVGPYRAPVTAGEIIPWVLLAAAVIAAAWLIARYLRKHRKGKPEPVVIVNPDPAHVIAFRELEMLKQQELWQKGQIKNYYTRLTEILRQYLENRYKVYSLELTTSETLTALLRTGFKKDGSYNMLRDVLTGADLVKFAKYVPEKEEHERYYNEAWDFVQATREQEPAPQDAPDYIRKEGAI